MINELKQSMELLQNGLNEYIYLRKALMTLSKYFKYRGYDKDTNKQKLIDWISKQSEEYYGSKYYRYTWEDILKFIDDINNNTYKNNYKFVDKIEVFVTLGEMKDINMLKNKGDKLIAFSMLFLSKIYADENGVFYCSYNKFSDLVNIKKRMSINIINNLENYGVISVVERNKIKKTIKVERGYKVYKEKNKYKYMLKEDGEILNIINNEKYLLDDFYFTYQKCIDDYGFKVSRNFRKNIQQFSSGKVISI